MLKLIPSAFTPELLKLLMETGHGEAVLISDGNFPHKSMNLGRESIYIPAGNIADLLDDILRFFPLDSAVDCAAVCMESVKEGQRYGEYSKLIENADSKIQLVGRFEFYEAVKKEAVGIIVTADTTKGGNILIKKGVVAHD